MSIERIDNDLCNGCGICVNHCPADVIRMDRKIKKAVIRYPEDCILCGYCVLDCPQHAVFISPVRHVPVMVAW